jgi:hypothetical protein
MNHTTYYDDQIKPIIKESKKSEYKAAMQIVAPESQLRTKWIHITHEQLESVLKTLNTTIGAPSNESNKNCDNPELIKQISLLKELINRQDRECERLIKTLNTIDSELRGCQKEMFLLKGGVL